MSNGNELHYHRISDSLSGDDLMNFIEVTSENPAYIGVESWLQHNKPLGVTKDVYNRYLMYCVEHNLSVVSKNLFTRYIGRYGYKPITARHGGIINKVYKYISPEKCPNCNYELTSLNKTIDKH